MTLYRVQDPFTGAVVEEYTTATNSEITAAIDAANTATKSWPHQTTVAERAALLGRVAELHTERRDALAAIIVREMGKPLAQALGEVDFCAEIYQFYADNAEEFLAEESIATSAGGAIIRKSALGVLLGIMPWNFPLYQIARFAAPNLVVGNSILLKPAPQCPESASALEAIVAEAGFPVGMYTTVFADFDQVETIIADPRVQGVSLTGSERAGSAVAALAGKYLKKVVLELGGSDPFIVLSTDDVDATVEAAVFGRIDNNGQVCNGAKRFIIVDDLYDTFSEKFAAALSGIVPGDPNDDSVELGPLSSEAAAERLEDQVQNAVAAGATLVTGDGRRSGALFAPTMLSGIATDNPAFTEEFFGPVAQMYRVADEDEAVELANATTFGLGSFVFSTDHDQALRVADRLDVGMVFINEVGGDAAELPFGGVKRSGTGRELGRIGIEEFINKKVIKSSAWK